ncbi:transglycosylase domain-containing protein [Pseudochelatococcus contaminans]|uniref:Penicillin-binding protein 1A n=1 Tax=Pseudochelatococcus contaminans TaxID=1538103 RepID=A0A7W5Z644_9HYPH|nr:penicillin-binding protein 1A [Pseudochelatococcus contaminans]MBB3810704.1 penicillin-binding protein 1A [Pseudochelatococcus contaminans]
MGIDNDQDRQGRRDQGRRPAGSRREPRFDFGEGGPAHDDGAEDWRLSAQDRLAPRTGDVDDTDRNEEMAPRQRKASTGKASTGKAGGRNGGRSGRSRPPARKSRRRRSLIGTLFSTLFMLGIWGAIAVGAVVIYHFSQLPPIDTLTVPRRPPNIAVLAADGSLIANKGDTGGQTVKLKDLPPYLPEAFIAIEDHRFYDHWGIDPQGVARALAANLTRGSVAQGGSTLTQQLAKNLFLTQDRTVSRKIQEAILSLWLEQNYTKGEILALYLNRVYFGAGAYGVEAAALRYFGKPAKDVTLAEAAMLAGLVQAPSRLAPTRNPTAAQARAQVVLTRMAEQGFITEQQAKNALMTPAEAVKPRGAGTANYAADFVMDVLDDFIGAADTDIVVRTTIEPAMISAAERAITDIIAKKGTEAHVSQGALVALSNDGAIRALVGGRNYATSQFNRATAARRQPGSAFKPFVYLTALERGMTPSTVRVDEPVNFGGWQPRNFSRRYSGPMTLASALAQSTNTIVVKLAVELGPKAVAQTAQRLGITSPLTANATIALGTSEVSALELTTAYTALANGGIGIVPWIIRDVKTVDGRLVYQRQPFDLGRVIDEANVSMMNYMLHQAVTSGSARRGALPGYEVAAKTGTTQETRDAWFVGYTSGLVTSVWLGNDDNSPMKNVTGGSLPAEAWHTFMVEALKGVEPKPLPGSPWAAPEDAPLPPPEAMPPMNTAPESGAQTVQRPAPQREKNFFERLFGG